MIDRSGTARDCHRKTNRACNGDARKCSPFTHRATQICSADAFVTRPKFSVSFAGSPLHTAFFPPGSRLHPSVVTVGGFPRAPLAPRSEWAVLKRDTSVSGHSDRGARGARGNPPTVTTE